MRQRCNGGEIFSRSTRLPSDSLLKIPRQHRNDDYLSMGDGSPFELQSDKSIDYNDSVKFEPAVENRRSPFQLHHGFNIHNGKTGVLDTIEGIPVFNAEFSLESVAFQKRINLLRNVVFKLKNHLSSCHRANEMNNDDDDVEDYEPLSRLLSGRTEDSIKSDASEFGGDHTEETQYPCTRCTYVADDKDQLESHTETDHGHLRMFKRSSRRIYDLRTRQELEKAKVKINGKNRYRCPVCDKYLTSAHSFVTHQTIHSGQKLFSCQICGRKFRLLGFLKNHLKHIHSMKSKDDLNQFQTFNEPTVITNDDVTGQMKKGEKNYLDYKAIEKVKIIIDGDVFYKCEICDKKLTRVNYYLSHMSIHTGEKKFICHLCGKRFRLATMLQIHLRLTHERIKNYACDICQQKFGTSTNLSEHRRIHTGERPHICAKCGKRFKQKSALFVHNRTHTDYFPFQCRHCDSKFRIQSQLNYHMIKHTGETPYPCDVCGKAFAIKSHLNRHKKNHVEGRPYPCTECDKAFRHKKNLKSHLKNCHKIL